MNAPVRIKIPTAENANQPARYRLRIADYVMLHEKGSFRHQETELVDGQVFVLSPEWRPHFRIKSELLYLLRRAVDDAGLPYFVGTEGSIAISDTDMPRPDILLTSEATGDGPVPGSSVPLLVEVSSTTLEDDLGSKAMRYSAGGIPEYWVVDVTGQMIHRMWSPSAHTYSERDDIPFGQPIASITKPELSIRTTTL
ncbi:Uma2 family endonuclease [Sphingomonas sp.]|uniref:Uma2 family endonuclease n=1 Tax=Sphingomonas sp. TaxID=28214 RepID=UPI003B00449B